MHNRNTEEQDSGGKGLSEEDFWNLYSSWQSYFGRYANSLLRDPSLAEDVVAEAFISTLRVIRGGGGPSARSFVSYMRVSVRNEAFRTGKRQQKELTTDDIQGVVENEQPVEIEYTSAETWDAVAAARAFKTLPTRAQQILHLSEIEGQSIATIAKSLNITEPAAATAAFRARETLRTNYLLEVVSDLPDCGTIRPEYLAVHARGKSPGLRKSRIEAHVVTCERCKARLRRMASLRLPVLGIIGLATTGMLLGDLAARPASAEVSPDAVEQEQSVLLAGHKRAVGLRVGLSAGVVTVVVALLIAHTITRHGDGQPAGADGASAAAQTAASDPEATPVQPVGPFATTSSTRPTAPGQVSPSETSQPGQPGTGRQSANPPGGGVSTPTSPPSMPNPVLPDGVRSVEWAPAPTGYAAGGQGVRIELRVIFEAGYRATDYQVTVVAPNNVVFDDASASCSISSDVATCIPTLNMLELEVYRFQFVTTLTADAPLPGASIQAR